ncbi:MAG: alkaline phosphatase family protein [Myxococcales bacterium]|nr:alkaline phosphatase family protein [Myxococcales bacterium]
MDTDTWSRIVNMGESSFDWIDEIPVSLGPVVGHTTTTTSKIWVRARRTSDALVLRYAPAFHGVTFDPVQGVFGPQQLAGPITEVDLDPRQGVFPYASVTLTGLCPDTRYFYEIVKADRERRHDAMALARTPSFRTLPAGDPVLEAGGLRFAFFSCNGIHRRPSGQPATAMWRRLIAQTLSDEAIRFAVLGGDQVYADSVRDAWLADNHRSGELDEEQQEALYQELVVQYGRIYMAWWRRPEIRTFMAHTPCVMMWDDHDIYDGWGSHGDEHLAPQQVFFRAAATAFDAHQMPSNPDTNGKRRGHSHRAFHFRVGKAGFLVPDLRTTRRVNTSRVSALIGDEQWRYIDEVLDDFGAAGISHLFVVTSVPPIYADRWLSGVPQWMAGAEHDDLLDQWASRANRNDQLRMFGTLLEFRRKHGCNVLFLGGDVHAACKGRLVSKNSEFLRDGEREAVLYEAVSSAIGYAPPQLLGGFGGWMMKQHIEGEHVISPDYTGFIDESHFARNFSILGAEARKRAFRFQLHVEGRDTPTVYYFTGPCD